MGILDRFLRYIKIETACIRGCATRPSNFHQFDLIHMLVYELHEMGIENTQISNQGILYVNIPATPGCEGAMPIGFVTHLDTFPDFSDHNIQPQIIQNYNGGEIVLGESGLILAPEQYPHLKELQGQTLITTDGTTLLGADDKGGIAAVMDAIERIQREKIPHGEISLAFVSDEEIGQGSEAFEYDKFHAKLAYTVDGWEAGEIVYSNFNAAKVTIKIHGYRTHTGRAKGIMINAQLVGIEINNRLPANEIPSRTDGEEGFYHLLAFDGTVSETTLVYQIRDLEDEAFHERIHCLEQICREVNQIYGENCVEFSYEMEYRNMKSKVMEQFHLIDYAVEATKRAGVEPHVTAARGGTIGARMSYAGIICPNLGIGGDGYHGPMEHITVEEMAKVRDILVEIIRCYSEVKNIQQ